MIRYHSAVTQYGTRYNITIDTDNKEYYHLLQNVIRVMINAENENNTKKPKSKQQKPGDESYEMS